jgi:uncharacterized protein with ParB-like and HNH nuclease domain
VEFRFTPEHKNINELFGRDIKYIIPEYQRPYSWDCIGKSDKNNQVNVMWSDLIEYFNSDDKNTYFFGSMVFIGNGKQEYQVIDGQQRLTTMILLFAAIKCFLKEIREFITKENLISFSQTTIDFTDEILYNKKLFGAQTAEKKLRIEKNAGFDYDNVLTKAIECYSFDTIKDEINHGEAYDVSVRYFNNLIFFKEKLKESFLDKGDFTENRAEGLNSFIEFLKSRVSVVRILTPTFEVAYHIFEILNNRGLPLSNKDLFRNLIMKEWDNLKNLSEKYKNISPIDKWNELDKNFDLNDDFIGRWVESSKASKQQYSAFNDLKEIYERQYKDEFPNKKIEKFHSDIKRDLEYYTKITNCQFSNPYIKATIQFLLYAPNYRYSMNFLLALLKSQKGQETDLFMTGLVIYQKYLIYCILCVRFSYGPINSAIAQLNKNEINLALAEISIPEEAEQDIRLSLTGDFYENETPKLLLAKYIWIKTAETQDDTVEQILDFDKASLEHIIPQNSENTDWANTISAEFIREYTFKLGNMTILTNKMNAAAKNYSFSKKKIEYAKTKLPMTFVLSTYDNITQEVIIARQIDFVKTILKDIGITP